MQAKGGQTSKAGRQTGTVSTSQREKEREGKKEYSWWSSPAKSRDFAAEVEKLTLQHGLGD